MLNNDVPVLARARQLQPNTVECVKQSTSHTIIGTTHLTTRVEANLIYQGQLKSFKQY